MTQPSIRRMVQESTHLADKTAQDGRLAVLEAAAGFTEPPLGYEDAVVTALVENDASGPSLALGARFVRKGEIVASIFDFGNREDILADCHDAFIAAVDDIKLDGGGTIFFPDETYLAGSPIDIYRPNSPRVDILVRGESQWNTKILANFYGADKALIKSRDPLGLTRSSPTSLENIQLGTVDRDGPSPILLDIGGMGESRLKHVRFGAANNTHLSLSSLQNVRADDVVSFYGGKHYNYKATDGIAFTVVPAGDVSASADVFTAGDVGKYFTIYPSNGDNRAKYTIASVSGPRNAVLSGTTILSATAEKGGFEAAQGTMAAGSTTLTADAPCFTADDVGRIVIVVGARTGAQGAASLRARIQSYSSATSVVLDTAAGTAVTRTPFFTPAVDLYSTPGSGTLNADSNDVHINDLQIENFAGVGLSTTPNIFMRITNCKIHGESDPVDTWASGAHMILDDYAGEFSGVFDGAATGEARAHFYNFNALLTIDWLATRRIRNEKIFKAGTFTDINGLVEIRSLEAYRNTISGNPEDMVTDPNSVPRIVFTGLVNMLGDTTQAARIYNGKGSYYTLDGKFVRGNPTTTDGFDMILAGPAGVRLLLEDEGTKRWSIGNTPGGGTSLVIVDETAVTGGPRFTVTAAGTVAPGVHDTQGLGSSALRWADVFATKLTVGASGRIDTEGTGSPEGVLIAPKGSEYFRTDGTPGTLKYFKETGSGNTGWVAKW